MTRWVMMFLFHHLSADNKTLETMTSEVWTHLTGATSDLPAAVPFRNYVALNLRLRANRTG